MVFWSIVLVLVAAGLLAARRYDRWRHVRIRTDEARGDGLVALPTPTSSLQPHNVAYDPS